MTFLLFTTGGTIASVQSEDGLKPALSGSDLLSLSPNLADFEHEIRVIDLMSKDSSNMQPEDWLAMADGIRANAAGADAAIVLHGTDTMAWTASALSYMLAGISIPVVITGSMIPAGESGSDAGDNIFAAVQFAMQLAMYHRRGVSIAFDDTLIHGPRSSKLDSRRKHAFISVDCPLLGEMKSRGSYKIAWLSKHSPKLSDDRPWGITPEIERGISLLPIFPGMRAEVIDHVAAAKPKAVVIEGFGLGGIPFMGENLLPPIKRGLDAGVHFIIRTQALFGGTDLEVYEVAKKAADLGVISARDMTREALMTKLMLLLPVCGSRDELDRLLGVNMCDDVNIS